MKTLEWTRENDHVWGPFLYARGKESASAIIVSSGDGDDYPGARLRLSLGGHTFLMALPSVLVPPQRRKVKATYWDEATIELMGRDWYWNTTERQFGISLYGGLLMFKFGRQTHDSSTDKSAGFFLPWTQWRFIRRSFYDADGALLRTFARGATKLGDPSWPDEYAFSQSVPTVDFEFEDFDGERITAKTNIEEREWRFGSGWFRWLSWFRPAKIVRSLNLEFSSEVGKRKGSWKGGTTGHSVDMRAGETVEQSFRRYCVERGLAFITETPQ